MVEAWLAVLDANKYYDRYCRPDEGVLDSNGSSPCSTHYSQSVQTEIKTTKVW